MHQFKKKSDAKMIAAVASVVVAGAAGIAYLGASRSADPTEGGGPGFAVERSGSESVDVVPASLPSIPTIDPPAIEIPEPTSAPAFVVDRTADLVATGLAHYREREFAEAAAYFEAEDERVPDRGFTRYMLGLSLWKAGEVERAADVMQSARELAPDDFRTAVNASRVLNDAGRYDAALEAAGAAEAIDADHADGPFLVGRSLRNLGRRDEAVSALKASVTVDPDHGYALNLLGLTLLELDRELDAIDALERAVGLVPSEAFAHNNLGMAYERAGRRGEAVRHYDLAVRTGSGGTPAISNLARLDPDGSVLATLAIEDGAGEPSDLPLPQGDVEPNDGEAVARLDESEGGSESETAEGTVDSEPAASSEPGEGLTP